MFVWEKYECYVDASITSWFPQGAPASVPSSGDTEFIRLRRMRGLSRPNGSESPHIDETAGNGDSDVTPGEV